VLLGRVRGHIDLRGQPGRRAAADEVIAHHSAHPFALVAEALRVAARATSAMAFTV
jgi:hypothetical protein